MMAASEPSSVRRRAARRGRRRWGRTRGPPNTDGIREVVGNSGRPALAARGACPPQGHRADEEDETEARGRTSSCGLKCRDTPARRGASPGGDHG
ncbi:hypothetical protein NDU88_001305 [Pleurodeles waltl]|uniref:Uncharacterized protein n=1 Tax=Pleurodeles waltl TaxID=8319 RepID=A0AAV7VB04_PLEWA|nr:hypothetical protein NDU88_001305 [Pleurodeles waltl]